MTKFSLLTFILFLTSPALWSQHGQFPETGASQPTTSSPEQLLQATLQLRNDEALLDSIVGEFHSADTWNPFSIQRFGYENDLTTIDSTVTNKEYLSGDTPEWSLTQVNSMEYDSEGRLATKINYKYYSETGQLERATKSDYFYNSEGQLISIEYAEADANGDWPSPQRRELYFYDSSGLNNLIWLQSYLPDSDDFQTTQIIELNYQQNGQLAWRGSKVYEGSFLVDNWQKYYYYNDDGFLIEIMNESYHEHQWHFSSLEKYYYEPGDTRIHLKTIQYSLFSDDIRLRFTYFYDPPSATEQPQQEGTLECLLANPFVHGSTLQCKGGNPDALYFSLVDMLGREYINRQRLGLPLDTSSLPNGYYLLRVQDETTHRSFQTKLFISNP